MIGMVISLFVVVLEEYVIPFYCCILLIPGLFIQGYRGNRLRMSFSLSIFLVSRSDSLNRIRHGTIGGSSTAGGKCSICRCFIMWCLLSFLFSILLCVVAFIWRPRQDNDIYTYQQLGQSPEQGDEAEMTSVGIINDEASDQKAETDATGHEDSDSQQNVW